MVVDALGSRDSNVMALAQITSEHGSAGATAAFTSSRLQMSGVAADRMHVETVASVQSGHKIAAGDCHCLLWELNAAGREALLLDDLIVVVVWEDSAVSL